MYTFVVDGTKILSSKNTSNYADKINTSSTTSIGGKANTSHIHIIGDVNGLQGVLDGKQTTMTVTILVGYKIDLKTNTITMTDINNTSNYVVLTSYI
jgi:hypothetical protein